MSIYLFLAHVDPTSGHIVAHHIESGNGIGHIVHLGVFFIGVAIFLMLAPTRYQADRRRAGK